MPLLIRVRRHIHHVRGEEPPRRGKHARLREFRPELDFGRFGLAGGGLGDGVEVELDLDGVGGGEVGLAPEGTTRGEETRWDRMKTHPNEHPTTRRHEAQHPRPPHLLAHQRPKHGRPRLRVRGVDRAAGPGAHGGGADRGGEVEFVGEDVEEEVSAEFVLHLQACVGPTPLASGHSGAMTSPDGHPGAIASPAAKEEGNGRKGKEGKGGGGKVS